MKPTKILRLSHLKQTVIDHITPPPPPLPPSHAYLLQVLRRSGGGTAITFSRLKRIHAHLIIAATPPPPALLHALVRSYNASGALADAALLFDRSPPPSTPLLWNVLIRAHSRSPHPQRSVLLFQRMRLCHPIVAPDSYSFTFAITACSRSPELLSLTEALYCLAFQFGFASGDLFVGNALVGMYSGFGRVGCARKVFNEMVLRDVVTWTSLIDGYAKAGELGVACKLFEEMPDRNELSWVVVISGHVGCGMYCEAIEYFQRMMRSATGVKPNEAIIVCVLSACAHIGAIEQGIWMHAYIDRTEFRPSPNVSTALIDMYAKCGRIDCASQVFGDATGLRCDMCTWTSMITGFAMHGLGKDALSVFNQMVAHGVNPDSVTLLGVLNGCSHSGLVEDGCKIFYGMRSTWGIVPKVEHYGCLIDLLGRAGQLHKAFDTILSMPMEPDIIIWRALLSACRVHGDVNLAKRVMARITQLDPTNQGGGFVLLSNLYAATNQWEGVNQMRNANKIKQCSLLSPGYSWIEVEGTVHHFFAADHLHPQILDIRNNLEYLLQTVSVKGGYVANTRNVLFDLCEEEKEKAVSLHSEKLALAFGLMSIMPPHSIRIMKNLRICEDCHTFMKAVSQVFCREIIVRDRTRFHTFVDGRCSCVDYW